MTSAISTALSGLRAADLRIGAAATNIANIHSTRTIASDGTTSTTPPAAQEVLVTSQGVGGVAAESRASDRAAVKVYSPEHPDADDAGFVSFPNIDLAEELVNTQIAKNDYKANLNVIKTQDKLFENLLDIIT